MGYDNLEVENLLEYIDELEKEMYIYSTKRVLSIQLIVDELVRKAREIRASYHG